MTTKKQTPDKKEKTKPEKIQTAEGWKRKQDQLLRERNPEIKERKKAI